MLVDIMISRAAMGPGKIDVHRSATMICRLESIWRRTLRVFG